MQYLLKMVVSWYSSSFLPHLRAARLTVRVTVIVVNETEENPAIAVIHCRTAGTCVNQLVSWMRGGAHIQGLFLLTGTD
jgi:hypothetical protein